MRFRPMETVTLPTRRGPVRATRGVVLAVGALLLAACAQPAPTLDLTPEQWREDLDHLVQVLEDDHLSPWHHIGREEFVTHVESLRTELPSLSPSARCVRLMGVTRLIGDGYTDLDIWSLCGGLPVVFYWFGDELRVVKSDDAHVEWLGWRVTAIGGVEVAEAQRRLAGLVPQAESPTLVLSYTAGIARRCEVLATLGLSETPESARLTLRDDAGDEREVTLRSLAPGELWTGFNEARSTRPFSAGRPRDPLWATRLPDAGVVYLQFRSYPSSGAVKHVAEKLDELLRAPGVTRLLVDLRRNAGGDFTKGQLLIEIIEETVRDRGISVDVAIGRETFSAGMSNACHFHDAFDARYLGEVSGGRPNGYQETSSFVLPNSHIPGSVAQELYRFQEEDTDGLQPDVHLPPDWALYVAGRDPVLEWVLAQDRGAGTTIE